MQEEQELLRYWKPRIYKTEPVRTGKGDIDVSILIPVHNAMPYLYECLLSVLSQKRDGIRTEIILCDDHSDKETKEYVNYPRLKSQACKTVRFWRLYRPG